MLEIMSELSLLMLALKRIIHLTWYNLIYSAAKKKKNFEVSLYGSAVSTPPSGFALDWFNMIGIDSYLNSWLQ